MDRRETKYAKALDKRKKLYGIKREGLAHGASV